MLQGKEVHAALQARTWGLSVPSLALLRQEHPNPCMINLLPSISTNFSQVSRSTNNRSSSPTLIARLFISNQSPPAQEESNSWLALSQLKPVFSSKERQVVDSRSEFVPLTPTVRHPVGHTDSIRVTCYEQHKPQRQSLLRGTGPTSTRARTT